MDTEPVDLNEQEEALIGYVAGAFPASDPYALKSAQKMVEDYRKAVESALAEGAREWAWDQYENDTHGRWNYDTYTGARRVARHMNPNK